MKAQKEQGEDANSLHEESHVWNRHIRMVVQVNNGPYLLSSQKGRRGRKGETGARENRQNRKQHHARYLPLSHSSHNSSSNVAAPMTKCDVSQRPRSE